MLWCEPAHGGYLGVFLRNECCGRLVMSAWARPRTRGAEPDLFHPSPVAGHSGRFQHLELNFALSICIKYGGRITAQQGLAKSQMRDFKSLIHVAKHPCVLNFLNFSYHLLNNLKHETQVVSGKHLHRITYGVCIFQAQLRSTPSASQVGSLGRSENQGSMLSPLAHAGRCLKLHQWRLVYLPLAFAFDLSLPLVLPNGTSS